MSLRCNYDVIASRPLGGVAIQQTKPPRKQFFCEQKNQKTSFRRVQYHLVLHHSHQKPQKYAKITIPEQYPRTSPSIPRNLSKTLPPRSRKHPPRQRNPPPINRRPRPTHPLRNHRHRHVNHNLPGRLRLGRHLPRHPRPQQRSLHRQHPAQRPQNPRRLRSRHQQRNHLRRAQYHPKLTPIPRRLISHRPHQPTKPTRPLHRAHSNRTPLRRHTSSSSLARPKPPKPPRLKPLSQPLHLPANPAQPPIQQQHQRNAQQPPPTPTAHSPAQRADHGRQVQIRRGGCG